MTLLAFSDAVDIGGGRGRLAAEAAASLARIDAQLGRPADVNEAWRSPQQADANYAAWIRYLNGGPVAPYALPASQSIHCRGYAVDSDDWYNPAAAAVWRANGWRQTARYPGTSRDEPWHGEYFPAYDNHRYAPAGQEVEDIMNAEQEAKLDRLAADMDWLKSRVGGSGKNPSISDDVRFVKNRIGGSGSAASLTDLLRGIRDTLAKLITGS